MEFEIDGLSEQGTLVEDGAWAGLLTEQVRGNGRMFFGLAYRMLGDVQAAEDVCQAAFAKAWESRHSIKWSGAMKGWLTQVIINQSLQMIRRRKIEKKGAEAFAATQHADSIAPATLELNEAVWNALEHLPESTRTVVVLRLIDGMPGRQVSRLLDCSDSEVSKRLHQGMDALREVLR
jgi:RNA polymerase sigma-70 factor, ECF subfamily